MSSLHAISLTTHQRENVVFASYFLRWVQNKFESKYRKLTTTQKSHVLKICEYNMSFIQQVVIIYSMSTKEQYLDTGSNVARFCRFRTLPYILHVQCSNSIMYLRYIYSHSHHLLYLLLNNRIPASCWINFTSFLQYDQSLTFSTSKML